MSTTLAIIGGTGLTQLPGLTILAAHDVQTPYGAPSTTVLEGQYQQQRLLFLARHSDPHRIPPHQVNYRANIWALQSLGATDVLAVNACGSISADMRTEDLVVPDQLIDYTYGRDHTFFEGPLEHVTHIDLSYPYSASLRQLLLDSAQHCGQKVHAQGTYAATQGPRLETIAEVNRMARDGCHLVGMTGMPETVLAHELQLNYACLALIVNPAAGRGEGVITLKQIEVAVERGMACVRTLLLEVVTRFYLSHTEQ